MYPLKKYLPALIILFFSLPGISQSFSIKGRLIDGDSNNALAKGSISIASLEDSSKTRITVADSSGSFIISEVKPGSYQLVFSFTGYDDAKKRITVKDTDVNLGDVLMFRKLGTLKDVTVVAKIPPAKQNGDTTEFNAAGLKVNPDANAEDLIKKAPGITVDNGVVTAQGEEVKKVTIDGRQFFGDDATAALKNLPAEVIDKIQVFDRLSDQAQLTGIDDGNAVKSINIVTKANMRNGQFGRVYAGYGTDERYAAGGNVNIFNGNQRINLIGLFNNVNQQNFTGEDLLGVTLPSNAGRGNQGGGTRSGGGGGGNRGGGGGGNNNNNSNSFQVGMQPGIAQTNAVGVNFSDLWLKKKIDFSGSYFFNDSHTKANTVTDRQLFLTGDTSQLYHEDKNSVTDNTNHRINMRLEYKIDSNNTLIVAPNLSFQSNESNRIQNGTNSTELNELINSSKNIRKSDADGYNLRNDITYRHLFGNKRRIFTVNLNTGLNRRESDINLDAITTYFKTGFLTNDTVRQQTNSVTDGYNVSANFTYTEPVGKKGQVQVNYNPQYTKSNADQRNFFFDKVKDSYSIFDTSQSNLFENTVKAQNAGINYRVGDQKSQFTAGVNYQATSLNSKQSFPFDGKVHKTFYNWLPSLQWRKTFNKQSNLRINYRTSVNPPSVNQLQNVVNTSNPLFYTTGNPLLDQSYTNFLSARYSLTKTTKSQSFFAGVFLQQVNNYITNGTYVASEDSLLQNKIVLQKGSQLSKPLNLDGYYTLRSFVSYGFPIKPIKSNLNLNFGFNYGHTPGLVNYVENFSNNYTYSLGATLASNISEYIDFIISYAGNFNRVVNTIQPSLNNKYYYHSAGAKINLLTKSGWFVLNDVTNQIYSGLADGFNQSFWLWNISGGKKFLKNKRAELKVTVFDLLKQNQSISRNVADTYIEDVQTDVLQQYFMLTFTYTLRNFGHPASRNVSTRK